METQEQILVEKAARKDVRKETLAGLEAFLKEQGEPKFRAQQVLDWLWKHQATGFGEMNNLPQKLRTVLETNYEVRPLTVSQAQVSSDGTIKSAFKLYDGNLIEGVLIPADDRMTACVSSQVGCSLTCKFCATGYMDRKRNLEPGEIYDQVVAISRQAQQEYGQPLSNIVFMGMGEPLLNYQNVLDAIDRITGEQGLGMAAKRITVSTAGIAKMIQKLGDEEVRFRLALSLHAANDEKRNRIMPINESNSLDALRPALQHFYRQTGNRLTYEYIVFHGFNEGLEDARELYEFTKHTPCKVNLIEYNPIAEAQFKNAPGDKLERFRDFLETRGVSVTLRRSRGKDIDAACGQLAGKKS